MFSSGMLSRMAVNMAMHMMSAVGDLRVVPVQTRLRGYLGHALVVDSSRARLVWEPRRVLANYLVPATDVDAEFEAVTEAVSAEAGRDVLMLGGPPVIDPATPFRVHTARGTEFDVRKGDLTASGAAYRFDDPDLANTFALDFRGFDRWTEEDEDVVGHPRDPFHRIDVRPGSHQVDIRRHGRLLASSTRAKVLTETMLPARYYFPPEDVRLDVLTPSDTSTVCAYKGTAAYWAHNGEDVAWAYASALDDAVPVQNYIAFFNQRVDITVDGVEVERPKTPWSR